MVLSFLIVGKEYGKLTEWKYKGQDDDNNTDRKRKTSELMSTVLVTPLSHKTQHPAKKSYNLKCCFRLQRIMMRRFFNVIIDGFTYTILHPHTFWLI